jgi:hypothetical protein
MACVGVEQVGVFRHTVDIKLLRTRLYSLAACERHDGAEQG